MNETIAKIRSFNRFYMPSMNLLGDHYLGSEYSVTEARVFFEIYENEGCNAAHIAIGNVPPATAVPIISF